MGERALLLDRPPVARLDPRPPSFEAFYRDRLTRTVRQVALIVGDAAAAQDLAHDALVEVYRRWDELRDPGAYLYRCATNRSISFLRRRRAVPLLDRDLAIDDLDLEAVELVELLADLPDRQRIAVVLRYYEGLTEVEIAAALGCRPGTVGPLLTRARAALRVELADG